MNIRRTIKTIVFASLCTLAMAGSVSAADQGSPAEAETLVKKAVALIKSAGPDKAYEEITNGKSLKDRDLYVAIVDMNGKMLAHGANPKLVGKDLLGIKDPDGKLVIQMFVDAGKSKGKGWSESYKILNPVTQKLENKVSYFERVGETVVSTGVYKN